MAQTKRWNRGPRVEWRITRTEVRPDYRVCFHPPCREHICKGELVFVVHYWKYKKHFPRYFHPDCYVAHAREVMAQREIEPIIPPNMGKGRPRLDLTDEQRRIRKKLLNRYAYLKRKKGQLRKEMGLTNEFLAKSQIIGKEVAKVIDMIESVGGVPTKREWGDIVLPTWPEATL